MGYQGALRLGRLLDEGKASTDMISLMKRNNCGKALDIARQARDMLGNIYSHTQFHSVRTMNTTVTHTPYTTHHTAL